MSESLITYPYKHTQMFAPVYADIEDGYNGVWKNSYTYKWELLDKVNQVRTECTCISIYICTCIYACECKHVNIYVYRYDYIHMYTYMHIYVCKYFHIC